jgi:MFS family permease
MSVETTNEPLMAETPAAPAAPVAQKPLRFHDNLILSAQWFATNLHWGALLMVIIPKQSEEIAPDKKALAEGWVLGIGAIVALVVPLIAGILSDRCMSRWGRRRPFVAVGTTINFLGLGAMWYAATQRSLPLYLLGYMIVQLGNGIATAAYSGVIPDQVPLEQRGEASGYMAVLSQVGTGLGIVGTGLLIKSGPNHTSHVTGAAYVFIALALMLGLSVTLLGIREQPLKQAPPPMNWAHFLKSLWIDPRKYPDFAWVWITRALVTMGMWCVQPFLLYYLTDVVKTSDPQKTFTTLLGIILVTATVTGLLGGKISDKIGRKKVVYAANALMAFAAICFIFSHSEIYTYVIGAIYGFGYGAYFSVDWALGCDVLPNKADVGKDMAVWHIAMVMPQSLAPFLAGFMLNRFPSTHVGEVVHYSVQGYVIIFVLAAAFLGLGAWLLRNVRESRERAVVQHEDVTRYPVEPQGR